MWHLFELTGSKKLLECSKIVKDTKLKLNFFGASSFKRSCLKRGRGEFRPQRRTCLPATPTRHRVQELRYSSTAPPLCSGVRSSGQLTPHSLDSPSTHSQQRGTRRRLSDGAGRVILRPRSAGCRRLGSTRRRPDIRPNQCVYARSPRRDTTALSTSARQNRPAGDSN